MLPAKELRRVLPTLPRKVFWGPWYRAVAFQHLKGPPISAPAGSPIQPLWPDAAFQEGARFTPKRVPPKRKGGKAPGLGSIYLAEDEMTPLVEVSQVLRPPGSPVPLLFGPLVLLTVEGALSEVLDVSNVDVQEALGTNESELTGNWAEQQVDYLRGIRKQPPTQVLGEAAYETGTITGLRYKSAKKPADGFNVVVFADRLKPGLSVLKVLPGPSGELAQEFPSP